MNWATFLEKIEGIELSTSSIVLAVIVLLVVLTLMAREFMTWMVKTYQIRQDIQNLSEQIKQLQESVNRLERNLPVKPNETPQPMGFSFILDQGPCA